MTGYRGCCWTLPYSLPRQLSHRWEPHQPPLAAHWRGVGSVDQSEPSSCLQLPPLESWPRRANGRAGGAPCGSAIGCRGGSVPAGLAGCGDGSGSGRSWRSPAGAMWSAGRGRAAGAALLGLLLALSVPGSGAAKTGAGVVTCGSVLKLFNTQHRVRLHSHDVKYGSGARGLGLGIARGRGGG